MMPSMITIIAAAAAKAERRHVDAFHLAGATSVAAARPLGALGLARDGAFDRLVARGVLRESRDGAYYLDEAALAAYGGRPVGTPRVRGRPVGAARAVVGVVALLLLGALVAGMLGPAPGQ